MNIQNEISNKRQNLQKLKFKTNGNSLEDY